jgi:hypothetical protein
VAKIVGAAITMSGVALAQYGSVLFRRGTRV